MFKKRYTLRRYGKQEMAGGTARSPYADMQVWLDVQPLSAKELEALPEGKRSSRHIKAFGSTAVRTVDPSGGMPADRLWYHGQWFECEGSDQWDHTPLAHFESQWVAVPESAPMEPQPQEGGMRDDPVGTEGRTV